MSNSSTPTSKTSGIMTHSRSTGFGFTGLGQIASGAWTRPPDRKFPNPRPVENQVGINQPLGPELAVRVWVADPTMLTRKALLEIIRLLPSKDVHDLLDELIEELDGRSGDPDVEAEPIEDDIEAEAEVVEDDDEAEAEPVEDDDALVA